MDRRTFVKMSVGAGASVALAAGGVAVARVVVPKFAAPDPTLRYVGARRVSGPAPRGVPYIPIEERGGLLYGKATAFLGDGAHDTLAWLDYCGMTPPEGGDEALRYHLPDEERKFLAPWYADKLGEPIGTADFPGDDFGARFLWRGSITGVVVRTAVGAIHFEPEPPQNGTRLMEGDRQAILSTIFAGPFIATSNRCTHFCATAGYDESESLARPRDAWNNLFCTSHASNFDPRRPTGYRFLPSVR